MNPKTETRDRVVATNGTAAMHNAEELARRTMSVPKREATAQDKQKKRKRR
jgi:hypothetical protein